MATFLKVFLFVFAFSARADVVPSGVPSFNSSGALLFSPADLYHSTRKTNGWFTLIGSGSPGANNYNPLYRNGVAYQVPASTTTQCVSIQWAANGANVAFQLASDTSAITVGDTALTAGVWESGTASVGAHISGAAYAVSSESTIYNFGASTYAGWQEINAATNYYINLKCREIPN